MSKLIVIENIVVRQDAFGRYCLNDLHRAAVAQSKVTESQRPSVFLRSEGISAFAQKASKASQSASVNIIKGGLESGSWAVELIAIRYAASIDPAFEVQVYERFRDSVKSNNGALVEKVQAGLALLAFYKQELRIAPSAIKARKIAVSDREKQQVAFEQLSQQIQAVSALDARHTRELENDKNLIAQLERDVADGRRRLQINAIYPAVPTGSPADRMDDAARPRLDYTAQRNYFTLRHRIEIAEQKINGLQDYVRQVVLFHQQEVKN
ncbi:lysis system i-spanin subunit Rz [Serratia symbiotica]|uniref:lysis system i-spanin subunit Rz n=1 Tax=Serratia symbiotica TaxID=138074 RepID=UPI001DFC60CF|nr:lysis system i-spanin subunit Rz [Serratia symbiotica]MCX2957540.1 lysis system i-spanin subunit Rz [Serratia symbiotica]NIG87332.1 hypothetical protein [Serratia symbiotica]USS96664.1 lysis system i-spanin subunit Rz [Serratia symbiotica]